MDDLQPYNRPPMELHEETRLAVSHAGTAWFFKWLSVNHRIMRATDDLRCKEVEG